MNAINVIAPYRYQGMWVFDDPEVGLHREAFVAGADTMIDRAVADIPHAEEGFRMVFSAGPFPGHQVKRKHCTVVFRTRYKTTAAGT